ncbi:SCO family protein [uncultured Sphingomonas sp.]|uniref:SCO family protein n=1 Tax=uncultured Sphingomonas sp. TaxID=158754 RepID=UPI0025DB1B4B|nr:SCO family protein [uncultured Sphingomonas sp.]
MNKAIGTLATLLCLIAATAGCSGRTAPQPPLAGAAMGGPFVLTDQNGHRFDSRRLLGRYALFYFGYTSCPDACPADMQVLGKAMRLLDRDDPALAAKVQPIFVSVDPSRDTPAVVKTFVAAFHPRFIGLTGSEADIADVAKRYAIAYRKHPPAPGTSGYLVDHPRIAILFGPDGKPIALLPVDADADHVVAELRTWMR